MDTDQLDEEQLYFKAKYFKYKLKYVALKKQLGGFISIDVNAIGKLVNDTGALLTGAPQAQPQAKQRNKTLRELQEENISEELKRAREDVLHRTQNDRIIYFLATLFFKENESKIKQFVPIRGPLNYNTNKKSTFKNLLDSFSNLKLYNSEPDRTSLLDKIVPEGLKNDYYTTSMKKKDMEGLKKYLLDQVNNFINKGGHLNDKIYNTKLKIVPLFQFDLNNPKGPG
jgi:hypothetical protein